MKIPKSPSVGIVQISTVRERHIPCDGGDFSEAYMASVYGLGSDSRIYVWDRETEEWWLSSEKD